MTRQEAVKAIAAKQIELGAASGWAVEFANRRAGRIYAKLLQDPWQTTKGLTIADRHGRLRLARTADCLEQLKGVGAIQVAWDPEGYPSWAPCGTELRIDLLQD